MPEDVVEGGVQASAHRPGIDIMKGANGSTLGLRSPAEMEKVVLGEIPIRKSVKRRYKPDGKGGIIEIESEEPVQK